MTKNEFLRVESVNVGSCHQRNHTNEYYINIVVIALLPGDQETALYDFTMFRDIFRSILMQCYLLCFSDWR